MSTCKCSGSRNCCQGFQPTLIPTECAEGYVLENNKCLRAYTVTIRDGVDSTTQTFTIDDDDDESLREAMQAKFDKMNGRSENGTLYTCTMDEKTKDIMCPCAKNRFRDELKCRQYGAFNYGNDFTCWSTHYNDKDCRVLLISDTVESCAKGLSKSKAGYCAR